MRDWIFPTSACRLLHELNVLQAFWRRQSGAGVHDHSGAEICERKVFSAGVRFRLRQSGRVISGVVFGVGDDYPGMPGEMIDVAYRLTRE